jgi:hypothetical protein
MSSTILLPPRTQLCIRYCSNKHTHQELVDARRVPRAQAEERLVEGPGLLGAKPNGSRPDGVGERGGEHGVTEHAARPREGAARFSKCEASTQCLSQVVGDENVFEEHGSEDEALK